MKIGKFHYHNKEILQNGGRKMVRQVSIKNGKGVKSIAYYQRGNHKKTVKRRIHPDHMKMIQERKFVPGLFADCSYSKKNISSSV